MNFGSSREYGGLDVINVENENIFIVCFLEATLGFLLITSSSVPDMKVLLYCATVYQQYPVICVIGIHCFLSRLPLAMSCHGFFLLITDFTCSSIAF